MAEKSMEIIMQSLLSCFGHSAWIDTASMHDRTPCPSKKMLVFIGKGQVPANADYQLDDWNVLPVRFLGLPWAHFASFIHLVNSSSPQLSIASHRFLVSVERKWTLTCIKNTRVLTCLTTSFKIAALSGLGAFMSRLLMWMNSPNCSMYSFSCSRRRFSLLHLLICDCGCKWKCAKNLCDHISFGRAFLLTKRQKYSFSLKRWRLQVILYSLCFQGVYEFLLSGLQVDTPLPMRPRSLFSSDSQKSD